MSAVRIWFNRNFATNLFTLQGIRDNADGRPVHLIGSHVDLSSPMLTACDEVFREPALVGDAYVEYALEFCRRNRVDVFLPVFNQEAIAARVAEFRTAGVAVIVPPVDAIRTLADKAQTYRALAGRPDLVPPWREIRGSVDFAEACADLTDPAHAPGLNSGTKLVLKPARGVGADGVRFLVSRQPTLAGLLGPVEPLVTFDEVRRTLQAAEAVGTPVPGVLVMPYLERPEVSVDILARHGQVVVTVPRVKLGRDRVLDCDRRILQLAGDLVEHFGLDGLVNAQFRHWQGRPVLLEINTRPAGGLFQTRLSGVNLPWLAVKAALGEALTEAETTPVLGARYVTVSAQVPLAGMPPVQVLTRESAAGDLGPDTVDDSGHELGDSAEFTEIGPVVGVHAG